MQLTKAEEQIKQILWRWREETVQDNLKHCREEKPARTTVAKILNIQENKNFVSHTTEGRTNIYSPLVKKEDYSKKQLFGFIKDYFDGSFSSMTSFFVQKTNMTIEELDKIMEETKEALKEERKKNS